MDDKVSDKVFNEDERDALRGKYLSGADFEGEGLKLKIISKEAIMADNPKYGMREDGRGLKKGQTWLYKFETLQGVEQEFKNSSARLAATLARTNPSSGDVVHIRREGASTETKWIVVKEGEEESVTYD